MKQRVALSLFLAIAIVSMFAVAEETLMSNAHPRSQYRFNGWTATDMEIATPPASETSVLIDKAKAVGTNYVSQFKVTFGAYGIGPDFAGPVVVIDGVDYTIDMLPAQFWYDDGSSHIFAFRSPLAVSLNAKQYFWTNTSGLSTLQLGMIAVASSGNITGSYKTQYYLAVTSAHGSPSPTSGWFDSGVAIEASVDPTVHGTISTRYVCIGWSGTGSAPEFGENPATTFQISASSTLVWNWKTQNFLEVTTDPRGLIIILGKGWKDTSEFVTLTAPASVDNYTFDNWTVDGASQGNGVNSIVVTMSTGHTATAHYRANADLNGDGMVGWEDINMVFGLFGVSLSDPSYNPACDLNNDCKIDMRDIGTVARHFGEHYT